MGWMEVLLRKSSTVVQPRDGNYCYYRGGDCGEEENGMDSKIFGRYWKMEWTQESEERRCGQSIRVAWTMYLAMWYWQVLVGNS